MGRLRFNQVWKGNWQGNQRAAREELYPIIPGRSRSPGHHWISAELETDAPRRGRSYQWANGSDRFVLQVTNEPIYVANHDTNTVCGSQSITTAVKDALGFSIAGPSSIMKGGPSITLNTEAFGYA